MEHRTRVFRSGGEDVPAFEQMRHTQDSQGQILASACRAKSLRDCKLFCTRSKVEIVSCSVFARKGRLDVVLSSLGDG